MNNQPLGQKYIMIHCDFFCPPLGPTVNEEVQNEGVFVRKSHNLPTPTAQPRQQQHKCIRIITTLFQQHTTTQQFKQDTRNNTNCFAYNLSFVKGIWSRERSPKIRRHPYKRSSTNLKTRQTNINQI